MMFSLIIVNTFDMGEDLHEESKLVQAVEDWVESAALSLWKSLWQDVTDLIQQIQQLIIRYLPILLEYQHNHGRFLEDVQRLLLTVLLLVLAFWVLAPSSCHGSTSSGHCSQSHHSSAHANNIAGSMEKNSAQQQQNQQNAQPKRRSTSNLNIPSFFFLTGCGSGSLFEEESEGMSDHMDDVLKTDEERFELEVWPSLSVDNGRHCPYWRLVLPPSCRLVEPTALSKQQKQMLQQHHEQQQQEKKQLEQQQQHEQQQQQQQGAQTQRQQQPPPPPQPPLSQHQQLTAEDDSSSPPISAALSASTRVTTVPADDDNPAVRLQMYLSHFWFLMKRFIRLDIAGAIWTMSVWIQSIRTIRVRSIQQAAATEEDDEEEEEDVAEKVDVNKEKEMIENLETNEGPIFSCLEKQKEAVDGPDCDQCIKEEEEGEVEEEEEGEEGIQPQEMDDEGSHTDHSRGNSNAENDSVASNASSHVAQHLLQENLKLPHPRHGSFSTGPTYDEEKKEISSEDSTSVYHDLTSNSFTSKGEHPLEISWQNISDQTASSTLSPLVTKHAIALQQTLNSHHTRGCAGKQRDALDSYRRHSHKEIVIPERVPSDRRQCSTTTPTLASSQHGASHDGIDYNSSNHDHRSVSMSQTSETSAFFFETANSADKLKQLSIQVPVPDKNGYILGDDFLEDSQATPLLVFVNSRSGPQQGHLLITQLRRLLNPIQLWDLANGGPETILESFLVFTRLRILVCGGDGTVSWIISALEAMNLNRKWPPIAILPLGTGNDLARIHGWGGGYNNESLITILEQVSESYISLLDRWEVTIDDKKTKKQETKTFFNYLGVGADAQAALQVHYLRESKPQWFFSRMVNKAWYGVFGAEDMIKASSVNVRKEIKLVADGVELQLPSDSQGIIILNIDSYAGGVPLWSHGTKAGSIVPSMRSPRRSHSVDEFRRSHFSMDRVDSTDDLQVLTEEDRFERVTACDRPSSCQDGILEIVSIRGAFHLGQIKVGLSNAQRLCQCREVTITIKNKVAVQLDGEPWRQPPCTLRIKRKGGPAAVMLHRSADDGGVETEMSKLLDWAEERRLIDGEVHSILMKEFSRRIESKTRKRRVREKGDNLMFNLKKVISQGTMANMSQSTSWNGGIAF